jgi:hypothetical protein
VFGVDSHDSRNVAVEANEYEQSADKLEGDLCEREMKWGGGVKAPTQFLMVLP